MKDLYVVSKALHGRLVCNFFYYNYPFVSYGNLFLKMMKKVLFVI